MDALDTLRRGDRVAGTTLGQEATRGQIARDEVSQQLGECMDQVPIFAANAQQELILQGVLDERSALVAQRVPARALSLPLGLAPCRVLELLPEPIDVELASPPVGNVGESLAELG